MSNEMIRPHGKITKNTDGTFTITTNSGYQFNIQSLTYSTALGESTLDLIMQISDNRANVRANKYKYINRRRKC